MGRETKILLALLGLLGGAFLGVVSLKLFVPRPPAGTGPDVHADVATVKEQALVEPPDLQPPLPPPPLPAAAALPTTDFAAGEPATPPSRDPFVVQAAFEPAAADFPPPPAPPVPPAAQDVATTVPLAAPEARPVPPPPPIAAPTVADVHVSQPGDSWWSLAERHYGDGRFYRALFAWNRSLDPRISLVPGSRIEIPPADELRLTRPGLLPAD